MVKFLFIFCALHTKCNNIAFLRLFLQHMMQIVYFYGFALNVTDISSLLFRHIHKDIIEKKIQTHMPAKLNSIEMV